LDRTYKRFYPGAQGETGRKGRKSGENSGQAANCRAFCRSETDFGPAIRCLPRVPRWPFKIAQMLGHISTGRAPGRHPDGIRVMLRIIAESGCGRSAERGVRKDPSPGSARFPDGAGCGRPPAALNKGDDLHPGAAFADKRVNFKDFSEQARPGAPGFPRKVGIVLLRVGVCRGIGVVAIGARNGDSGPVRVGAIEAFMLHVT
jgi:hypothetical protein